MNTASAAMKATMRHRGSNVGCLRILTSNRLIRNGTSSRWPWKVIRLVAEVAGPIALRVETRSSLEPVPLTSSLTKVVEVRFVNANRCEHRLVHVLWISGSVGHTIGGRRHLCQVTRIRGTL